MFARRTFLLTALASSAGISRAQRPPKVIGLLIPSREEIAREDHNQLAREMLALGYAKDSLTIVLRADGDHSRLPALAEELARLRVDLIISDGTNASVAARRASPRTPVVFYEVADPVAADLADSLSRPGRNSTGLTNFPGTLLAAKRVALLRELVPNLARVAYLTNPVTGSPHVGPYISSLGVQLGFETLIAQASSLQEMETAFKAMTDFHAQGVIIQIDTFFYDVRRHIAETLLRDRLPAIFADKGHVEVGGLMSYAAATGDTFRQLAIYVDTILRGGKAGEIAIQQPTKFELVINRRTAESLRLKIPPALLLQADRIIE